MNLKIGPKYRQTMTVEKKSLKKVIWFDCELFDRFIVWRFQKKVMKINYEQALDLYDLLILYVGIPRETILKIQHWFTQTRPEPGIQNKYHVQ